MKKQKTQDDNYLKHLFEELNIKYEAMEIDDDLNYLLHFIPSKLSQSIGVIDLLVYYSYKNESFVVICPNIYKLKEKDSTLSVLSALNKANTKLTDGNVILKNNNVTYRCVKSFGSAELITKESLQDICNDVVAAVLYTIQEIRDIKKDE